MIVECSSERRRLLLVDGMAGAYRFYFAIQNISTGDGQPTNAVFGFIRMMQQLLRVWKPTHCAVVFDGGIPPLRLALVPGYKANRKPMPDSLRSQLPILNAYLDAAAIVAVRLDACEADDVIATLASRASDAGSEVMVATSDKDMFQLVSENVRIVSLAGEPTMLDAQAILAKTGVSPVQIPDWLALTGDNADNIRGVPGIGPKTAAKLLGQFGQIEDVYTRLHEVENQKIRQLLDENRDIVARNQKMVRLDCAVEGVPAWETLRRAAEPVGPLLAFYRRYELRAFVNDLIAPQLF